MATDFPAALDTSSKLPNPTGSNTQSSPDHAGLHTNVQDAVKAVEAKLGTGATTPATNTLLIGTGAGTSAWSAITSAQLAAALSDETGTGSAVFANTPVLITPKVDTINENTTNNGVTVGGVNLKAGVITTANAVATTALAASAVTRPKIDWSTLSLNIKSATNASSPSLANASQDLASSGLTMSYTLSGPGYALVTVSLGISSQSDFEFRPEIRVNGAVVMTFAPAAGLGSASNRVFERSFTYSATLGTGTSTISAGVTLSSATAPNLAINGGTIAAIVLGNVTA